ncbi:tetratricopeptide repeat protein [Oligoflexus tunisiensis]|uniref:tetratricopeptide repeat protein n=1 Tax=Oligoflexus tunisiensis TaxID=708132 RepID=UPI00114CABF1|nr:tetratricopeptide repeat protein [Oligoflexus tunisiensis]
MPFKPRVIALVVLALAPAACQSVTLFEIPRVATPVAPSPAPVPLAPAPSPLLDQANQYARDGLYREAVAAFRKHLSDRPKDAAAHRTLGIVYVKTGAYKLAIHHLQEALPAYPDNAELNYYLGEAYRTQTRYADAIFHYKKALQAEPKNLNALKALSWSYYSIRYYAEALKTAKTLKKLDPNDFQISIINARILNKIGMNDKALAILNKTEALSSPQELAYLNSVKGDILLDEGHHVEAEQAYRRALQDQPLLPGALTGLARKFIKDQQNIDMAVTYLERALRIRPNLMEAYFLLGQALEKKDPKKSLENYRMFAKEAAMDPEFQQELAFAREKIAAIDGRDDNAIHANNRVDDLEDEL